MPNSCGFARRHLLNFQHGARMFIRPTLNFFEEIIVMDAELVKALSQLAWPMIVAVVLVALYPVARQVLQSRAFTVEVGKYKLSVQEATDGLRDQINQLRDDLVRVQRT